MTMDRHGHIPNAVDELESEDEICDQENDFLSLPIKRYRKKVHDLSVQPNNTTGDRNSESSNRLMSDEADIVSETSGKESPDKQLKMSKILWQNLERQFKQRWNLINLAILYCMVIAAFIYVGVKVNSDVTDGGWSEWEEWGNCSSSCGIGSHTRRRTCSKPEPSRGGKYCAGDSSEFELCKMTPCSVRVNDGGWSEWQEWGKCSSSCGIGSQIRRRTCSKPEPSNGGTYCDGDSSEFQLCEVMHCPVTDGGWSGWGDWEECSSSCDNGLQSRVRTCSQPEPGPGGKYCLGKSSEYQLCARQRCAGWVRSSSQRQISSELFLTFMIILLNGLRQL